MHLCKCPQKLQLSRTNLQAGVKFKSTCRLPKLSWVSENTNTHIHTHTRIRKSTELGKKAEKTKLNQLGAIALSFRAFKEKNMPFLSLLLKRP